MIMSGLAIQQRLYTPVRASKRDTLNQCWLNVGPTSQTVDQPTSQTVDQQLTSIVSINQHCIIVFNAELCVTIFYSSEAKMADPISNLNEKKYPIHENILTCIHLYAYHLNRWNMFILMMESKGLL